jgi:hypothetical protein
MASVRRCAGLLRDLVGKRVELGSPLRRAQTTPDPAVEGAPGSIDGRLGIGRAGLGHQGNGHPGARIDGFKRFAAGGIDEFTVNKKLVLFHGCLSFSGSGFGFFSYPNSYGGLKRLSNFGAVSRKLMF